MICTKGGGGGRVCTQVTRHAVVLDQSVFHAVACGFFVSGTWIPDSLSRIPDTQVQEIQILKAIITRIALHGAMH